METINWKALSGQIFAQIQSDPSLWYRLAPWFMALLFLGFASILGFILVRKKKLTFPRPIFMMLLLSLTASAFFAVQGSSFPTKDSVSLGLLTALIVTTLAFIGVLIKELPRVMAFMTNEQSEQQLLQKTQELREMNAKLAAKENEMRVLVENNPDAIARIDKNFRHLFANQSVVKSSGLMPEQLVGKTIYELDFPESFVAPYETRLQQVFDKGETIEWEITGNAEQPHFLMHLIPLKDDKGNTQEILVMSRDITERKAQQLQLQKQVGELQELSKRLMEKNRQLEDFSHIVSHNLRSPVRNAQLLWTFYDDETTEAGRQELVAKLKDVGAQLNNTLEDLSEIIKSRPNENIDRETISFQTVMKGLLESLAYSIKESDAQIEVDFEECPVVHYPKVYLESIMLNLLTNALKYRDSRRRLSIQVRSYTENGKTCFQVKDNGLGIDLSLHRNRLFGLNNTFHDHPDARGMGLFITKNQIEALGGSIQVESKVGEGSTFTVILGTLQN